MRTNNLVILSLMLLAVSCGKKEEQKAVQADLKPKVKVEVAIQQKVSDVQEFTASVEPEAKNNITPAAPGRIRKIFVEVGQNVRKGQKLAQMDVANLSNSESQIDNLRRVYKRVTELFYVGGASQQELDNAKLQLNMAETNLNNLQENTYLLSPNDGMVTARNYDNGDIYNGQMPILTVMQMNPIQIKVNISESNYAQVKTGMPVEVNLDVFPGQHFRGKVHLIYPTIDERTRTFPVEIRVENPGQKIRPGMFARVNIDFGKSEKVLVADLAVVKQAGSGERYVFVYENGKVRYQTVQLGRHKNDKYEILSGVKSDEQIVVAGQSKLRDGIEVELVQK